MRAWGVCQFTLGKGSKDVYNISPLRPEYQETLKLNDIPGILQPVILYYTIFSFLVIILILLLIQWFSH